MQMRSTKRLHHPTPRQWVIGRLKKKRNHSNSSYSNSEPPTSPQERTHKNKKKLFITKNRYEVLSQMELPSVTPMKKESIPKLESEVIVTPPPPIFIKDVHDFPGLCTELVAQIDVNNFHCKSTTDRLKIQTANPESYRKWVHFLREEKAEFHTCQLNKDKSTCVVIRNIHPSTPTDLIKTELETRLFEVRQVTQVLHRLNKNRLPLFFVDLKPTIHSNEIFYLIEDKLKNRIKLKLSLSVLTANLTDTPRHIVDTRHAAYVVAMIIPHLHVKKSGTNLHAVLFAKETILQTIRLLSV